MKNLLKLEEFALLALFTIIYFYFFNGNITQYLIWFFVPDISFLFYLINPAIGAVAYNVLHHKGMIILIGLIGFYFKVDYLTQVCMIFLAHSCFDRMFGYGLKYLDAFEHTHLGWIGKGGSKSNFN